MENIKAKFAKRVNEDETFWQQHIAAQAASKLSKLAYCHLHQVDYARFMYWLRKAAKACGVLSNPALVKVKLAADAHMSTGVLCTLQLKSGCYLQIHDMRALPIIFDQLN
jgi:hypothetical protein